MTIPLCPGPANSGPDVAEGLRRAIREIATTLNSLIKVAAAKARRLSITSLGTEAALLAMGEVIWPSGTACENLSSPLAKNFSISFFRNTCILRPVLPHERDVRVVTDVGAGCGGRDDVAVCMHTDERHHADGEIVWSWRPDAGVKRVAMREHRAGDRGKKAGPWGEHV